MSWYEILLCEYQPMPFMVKADTPLAAIEKTFKWAIIKYPGLFIQTDEARVQLRSPGFPQISEIGEWN